LHNGSVSKWIQLA